MAQYEAFNKYNVAPPGTKQIGVYNSNGKRVGRIPLGPLTPPRGEKLYSFSLISDPHTGISEDELTALGGTVPSELPENIQKNIAERKAAMELALRCLSGAGVEHICIAGDLVGAWQVEASWDDYKEALKGAGDTPVHAIAGNHEMMAYSDIATRVRDCTGHGYDDISKDGICYTIETHGDVFILMGAWLQFSVGVSPFLAYRNEEDVNLIKQVFEENRNKRCFVIQHPCPANGSHAVYKTLPLSMYEHYKNITVFHGHTHMEFEKQTEMNEGANYQVNGFRSVHTPSVMEHSQGYIVDVYREGIHLRGVRFTSDQMECVPIATYWIDTSIETIDENTYKA